MGEKVVFLNILSLFEIIIPSSGEKVHGLWYGYLEIFVSVYGSYNFLYNYYSIVPFQRINHTKLKWLKFAVFKEENYLHIPQKLYMPRMRKASVDREQNLSICFTLFWHLLLEEVHKNSTCHPCHAVTCISARTCISFFV